MLLWLSIWIALDFYGYPCIDLLWILDPGLFTNYQNLPAFMSRHILAIAKEGKKTRFVLRTVAFAKSSKTKAFFFW